MWLLRAPPWTLPAASDGLMRFAFAAVQSCHPLGTCTSFSTVPSDASQWGHPSSPLDILTRTTRMAVPLKDP